MMVRVACHLPPLATPVMAAPSSSRMPFRHSNLHIVSTLTHAIPFLPSPNLPSLPRSSSFPSNNSIRFVAMPERSCTRASASFSSGSGLDGVRFIKIQNLLVKEDNIQLLEDLHQRALNGEDLGDLAYEYSICPSKFERGMLGWVQKGQMVPEFEEAAFGAPLNKIRRCKTPFGWYLFQVLSEKWEELSFCVVRPEELHAKLQDPAFLKEAQLIDVREPDEVELAFLPGFTVFPLREWKTWGPKIITILDPQKETYVLSHRGYRSSQVAKFLQTEGFMKIFNVAGGIHAYSEKADPTIPTYWLRS